MALSRRAICIKVKKRGLVIIVLSLIVMINMLDHNGTISLRFVITGIICFPGKYLPVNFEQIKNSECPNYKGESLLKIQLKTDPSQQLWDGFNIEKLKSLKDFVTEDRMKNGIILNTLDSAFLPCINATYRRLMKHLIVVFNDVAKKYNVTYFLHAGSLIGSYRHHGMIPWDDDVDISVYEYHKSRLKAAFSNLPNTYKFIVTNYRWKLVYRYMPPIREGIVWSYPFLDILFFGLSSQSVYDYETPLIQCGLRYNICDVFPLVERPFWDLWLPAPRRADIIINASYANIDDLCVSLSYSHATEERIARRFTVPCDTLREYYPFVERTSINETMKVEQLKFKNSVVHTIVVKN
ncbi:hypothetical protein LSH36_1544g00006 [Paralvinella palmiformis]|uniref:LicD/FKTN/FKRP nucleotidyltransferase domain-containing protein n=1 Tax=Paralvinella palmiformis TaxID=53620 RepID=A0AAD9IS52_9ANNE|nr:hypothetical protein LSH36_1544g00006 [Paralvinella palmiformis]